MAQECDLEYTINKVNYIGGSENNSIPLHPKFMELDIGKAIKILGRHGFEVNHEWDIRKTIIYGVPNQFHGDHETTLQFDSSLDLNKDMVSVIKEYSINGSYSSKSPGWKIALRNDRWLVSPYEVLQNLETFKEGELEAALKIYDVLNQVTTDNYNHFSKLKREFDPTFFERPSKMVKEFNRAMYEIYQSLCVKKSNVV